MDFNEFMIDLKIPLTDRMDVKKEFPKLKVEWKHESKNLIILVSSFVFKLLYFITFKKVNVRYEFRTTTQGNTIYLEKDYHERLQTSKLKLFRHELEHIRQWNKWSLIYPITYMLNIWSIILPITLALIGLPLVYVLLSIMASVFIPAGLSFRGLWELEAFTTTPVNGYEYDYLIRLLKGSSYYFALSFIPRKVFVKYFLKKSL